MGLVLDQPISFGDGFGDGFGAPIDFNSRSLTGPKR